MDKIMILYNNGFVKKKNEHKLNHEDIMNAKYLLIPTTGSSSLRNYILIEPSEYLLFDKAIIEYQKRTRKFGAN